MNQRNLPHVARVEHLEVMPDASGAPAVISFGPSLFAMDMLGEIKCTRMNPDGGSRWFNKVAADRARAVYSQALEDKVSDEWLDLNKQMYQGSKSASLA